MLSWRAKPGSTGPLLEQSAAESPARGSCSGGGGPWQCPCPCPWPKQQPSPCAWLWLRAWVGAARPSRLCGGAGRGGRPSGSSCPISTFLAFWQAATMMSISRSISECCAPHRCPVSH